jgi:hypothetical protein
VGTLEEYPDQTHPVSRRGTRPELKDGAAIESRGGQKTNGDLKDQRDLKGTPIVF